MVPGNSVAESVLLNLPQKEASSAALPSASSQVTQLYQLTNAAVFCKDQRDGRRWTQSRLHLFSWKTPLPHMQIAITQPKKSPLSTRDTSLLPDRALPITSNLCCHHVPNGLCRPKEAGLCRPKEAVLPQCASVSHGRESLTLQQYCTLKSAHYPAIS